MGLFGKVSSATSGGVNAEHLTNKFGEFLARVEKTKIIESDSGTYGIVEVTLLDLINNETGALRADTLYCNMQKFEKHELLKDNDSPGMGARFVARWVGIFNGVESGHAFFANDDENDAKWEELSEEAFGKRINNPETEKYEYVGDNPYQGAVVHLKVVPDNQSGKKEDKKKYDADGNLEIYTKVHVLGLVPPADLPADVMEKYGKTLHPNYQADEA